MRSVDESLMIIRAAGFDDQHISLATSMDPDKLDEWAGGLIDNEAEQMFYTDEDFDRDDEPVEDGCA